MGILNQARASVIQRGYEYYREVMNIIRIKR